MNHLKVKKGLMFYNKVITKWYKIKKTIMKVITNLNSVISLFLCEGHCSFKVLIFFFAIFATVRRKVSKMRSSIYSKIDLGASKSKSIPQKQDFYGTVKHDIHVISFMPNYTFMRVKSLDLRFVICIQSVMTLLKWLKDSIACSSNVCLL